MHGRGRGQTVNYDYHGGGLGGREEHSGVHGRGRGSNSTFCIWAGRARGSLWSAWLRQGSNSTFL